MTERPTAIEVSSNGKSALFRDAPGVKIPPICAVCGEPASESVGYAQDHLPITLPGVALLRWTDVKVPYCGRHAVAFHKRFKMLRIAQGLLFAVVMVAWSITFIEPLRMHLGVARLPDEASLSISGVLFLILAATIFVVKPRLYDVFIKQTPQGVRISCKFPEFIAALARANGDTRH